MILRTIRINGYGRLRDRTFAGLSRLVVVRGPNEAGKSTLRRFVQDLLYGFEPANLSSHPYAPWDGGEMGGEAEIERKSGERVVLRRRLLSNPSGSLLAGDRVDKIGNHPMDGLGAVTRKIFEHVYSLGREDLEFPEEAWSEVKDRLVGAAGLPGIRPPREVAEELEEEANKLWRAKRKGGSAAARLQEEMRELGKKALAAEERDRQIREKQEELAALEAETGCLEDEKIDVLVRLERAQRLTPFRKRIEGIRRNEEIAGAPDELSAFPEDIERSVRDLEERAASLSLSLEKAFAERARLAKELAGFGGVLVDALRRGDEVRGAVRSADLLGKEREDLASLRGETARKEGALHERARLVLEDPKSITLIDKLSAVETTVRIRAYRKAREKRIELEAREDVARVASPLPSLRAVAALGALGLALAGASFAVPAGMARTALAAVGVGAIAAALLLALWSWNLRRRAAAAAAAPDRGAGGAPAREEERARLASVLDLLRPAGVLPSRLEDPDESLAADLTEMERGCRERDVELARIAAAEARIRSAEEGILSLARSLSLDVGGADDAAQAIARLLEEAKQAERTHSTAATRMPGLEAEILAHEEEAARVRSEKETMERRLLALGAGDLAACVASIRERREAARKAKEAREQLEGEGGDFDLLSAEIDAIPDGEAAREYSDEEVVRLRQRKEEIEVSLRSLESSRTAVRKDAEHLSEGPGRSEVEGERKALQNELGEVCRRRDRLVLLAGIVREADRRYRAEHEPDIVARAAEHLSLVSGGRYASLLLARDGDGLEVQPPGAEGPVPAETPISRGTLDQLFLCLRVALVDHLEGGGEPLPLFLDDVLLHWDEERRDRGLEVLRRVAEERQVFLLTCRSDLLEWAREAGGAVVELPAPGARDIS